MEPSTADPHSQNRRDLSVRSIIFPLSSFVVLHAIAFSLPLSALGEPACSGIVARSTAGACRQWELDRAIASGQTPGMPWSRDTRLEARKRMIALARQVPFERRLATIDAEFATSRSLVLSGLRRRSPCASDEEIEAQYYRLMLGPLLGEQVLALKRARRSDEAGT